MTGLPKFTGLELPVVDGHILNTVSQYKEVARNGQHCFTRETRVRPVEDLSLKAILETADREFSIVSVCTGANVVGHEWCLFPDDGQDFLPEERNLARQVLPKGYLLGATVTAVLCASATTEEEASRRRKSERQIIQGIDVYEIRPWPRLSDMSLNQFAWAHRGCDQTEQPRHWLLDIEPLLRLK